MFKDYKSKLDLPSTLELLEYSVFPDPDRFGATLQGYKERDDWKLYGLEEDGELIGIAGFQAQADGAIELMHLAVKPEHRRKGYGRGVLLELLEQEKPSRVIAETDEEAVDFYRSVGFTVYSLGEKFPGVERFRCIYEAEEEE